MGRLHSYLKIERRKSVPIIHLKEMIADVKKTQAGYGLNPNVLCKEVKIAHPISHVRKCSIFLRLFKDRYFNNEVGRYTI